MPHLARLKNLESRMHRYLAVVDFEATCTDRNDFPVEEMEIIEFGIVVLDLMNNLKVVDEYASFVKPVLHPELTPFCTALTSIRQADVDAAPSFQKVSHEVAELLSQYHEWSWASWGNSDRNLIEQDARRAKIEPCLPPGLHTNFKAFFSSIHNLGKQMGLKKAVELCGLQWTGTHHRAISDARNLAALSSYVLCRSQMPKDSNPQAELKSIAS